MDITDADQERLDLGVEQILKGQLVTFHGVEFRKDSREGTLCILSRSDWDYGNTTPDHAIEKIRRAKIVLDALKERSRAFKAEAERLPHVHVVGDHDPKGGPPLAQEAAGKFEWFGLGPWPL
jgi:hypothetical protein